MICKSKKELVEVHTEMYSKVKIVPVVKVTVLLAIAWKVTVCAGKKKSFKNEIDF